MKRLFSFVAALLVALVAGSAFAADAHYYVKQSPVGVDNTIRTGLDSTSNAWATVGFAISRLNAASIGPTGTSSNIYIHVLGNTGGSWVNPTTAPTGGGRYIIVGRDSSAAPGSLLNSGFPGASVTGSYITFQGLYATGSIDFDTTATRNVVYKCTVIGGSGNLGDYNDFRQNVFSGNTGNDAKVSCANDGNRGIRTVGNAYTWNTITLAIDQFQTNGLLVFGDGTKSGTKQASRVDSLTFWFNTIDLTESGAPSHASAYPAVAMYCVMNSSFRGNHWTIRNQRNPDPLYDDVWKVRNSTKNVTFDRDTIKVSGFGTVRFTQNSDPDPGTTAGSDQVRNLTIDSCYINTLSGFQFLSGFRFINITRSVIVGREAEALSISGDTLLGSCQITHNTLVTNRGKHPAVMMADIVTFASGAKLHFKDNIVARISLNQPPLTNIDCPSSSSQILDGYPLVFWTKTPIRLGHLNSTYNVYWSNVYGDSPGDRTFGWQDGNAPQCSKPGDNTKWESDDPVAVQDSTSIYVGPSNAKGLLFAGAGSNVIRYGTDGVPVFGDSSGTLDFDATLACGSGALLADSAGATAGAVAYANAPFFEYETMGSPGDASFSNDGFDFTPGQCGSVQTGAIFIVNRGCDSLIVTNIRANVASLTFNDSQLRLGPQSSGFIYVTCTSPSFASQTCLDAQTLGEILMTTNVAGHTAVVIPAWTRDAAVTEE